MAELLVLAEPVERTDAESGVTTEVECHRVVACGHVWTAPQLTAYQGGAQREGVACENCRVVLFDGVRN